MHIGYSFFFFFPGALAGCNSASVGRDWERSSTPHGWQKPPCFDRIQRGGEQVFQLCPCSRRIKLRGHAARWHGEPVRRVIVSIPAPVAPRICVAPRASKRSTWEFHFLQRSKPRWRKMKDGSEIFNLKPPLRRGPFCPILRAKVPWAIGDRARAPSRVPW